MATVTLDGVRKSYGTREVVHGVSCDVEDGELVVTGRRPLHRPCPVHLRIQLEALLHQVLADELAQFLVVVDQEQAGHRALGARLPSTRLVHPSHSRARTPVRG